MWQQQQRNFLLLNLITKRKSSLFLLRLLTTTSTTCSLSKNTSNSNNYYNSCFSSRRDSYLSLPLSLSSSSSSSSQLQSVAQQLTKAPHHYQEQQQHSQSNSTITDNTIINSSCKSSRNSLGSFVTSSSSCGSHHHNNLKSVQLPLQVVVQVQKQLGLSQVSLLQLLGRNNSSSLSASFCNILSSRLYHTNNIMSINNTINNKDGRSAPTTELSNFVTPLHPLTCETTCGLRQNFYQDEKNLVSLNACTKMDPLEVCLTRSGLEDISHIFSHKVEIEGKPMTNQKQSGRCWLFAFLNAVRVPFMKQYNLDEFEFSQNYLFFWDKLERSNHFLNVIAEAAKNGEEVDGRLFSFLLHDPISDGGQWDMIVNLVNKYGMLPKKCFPETFSSESSARMNAMLRSKLREYAKDIYELTQKNGCVRALIAKQISEIYKIIGICLGIPKGEFTWEYYDKSKGYHKIGPITPQAFYKEHVKPVFNVEDKVCLINDPRPKNEYGRLYCVQYLGNMTNGRSTTYNNQPIALLKKLVVDSIKAGEVVWYGCEVQKRFAVKQGVEDLKIHDYKSVFGLDVSLPMTKAERLLYGESSMSHAMVITAVNLENDSDEPLKFRVENSWGDDRCEKGYILMTSEWFDEFVFEVVIDKSHVPQEVLDVFNQKPVVLPAWDPMGNLARC